MQITHDRIEYDNFVLQKLQNDYVVKNFDCGNPELNDYFNNDSQAHRLELMTQSYYLYERSNPKCIIALVDVCNDSIAHDYLPKRDLRNIQFPKRTYKFFPALKIARLGVSKEYKGQKLGSLVLNLLKIFFVTNNNSGCRFFTLDAYREAKDFYLKNNFIPALLPEDDENPKSPTIPMYFDLKRIEL